MILKGSRHLPPEDASKLLTLFLSNNRHKTSCWSDRDPEISISLKFKDGGQAFLDEIEEQDQDQEE